MIFRGGWLKPRNIERNQVGLDVNLSHYTIKVLMLGILGKPKMYK